MDKKNMIRSIFSCNDFFCLCIFLGLLHVMLVQPALAEYEKPGELKTISFVQPGIMKGKYHTMDETTYNDGLFNHYQVKSPFASFKVFSTRALLILVHEINAIATMKKVETDNTAMESLEQSGKNTVTGQINFRQPYI